MQRLNVAAKGGGLSVLVLQEFFSLAWSSVLMSRGDQGSPQVCSILAAGGKRGVVKLIHPRNNLAYGEFRASRKALSVLRFHEQQGNFLFSKSHWLSQSAFIRLLPSSLNCK